MNRMSVAALLLFASTAGYAQETGRPGTEADTPAATSDSAAVERAGKTEEKLVCRRRPDCFWA